MSTTLEAVDGLVNDFLRRADARRAEAKQAGDRADYARAACLHSEALVWRSAAVESSKVLNEALAEALGHVTLRVRVPATIVDDRANARHRRVAK